jgi:hypothetical protein
MQQIPIPFEVTNLKPCFTLRSRREVNTGDAANSRLVEHWQTDAPALLNARRDRRGEEWWNDMNPTPSRLYRESVLQFQPFVVPGSEDEKKRQQVEETILLTQNKIESLTVQLAKTNDPGTRQALKESLKKTRENYDLLTKEQERKGAEIGSLATPSFGTPSETIQSKIKTSLEKIQKLTEQLGQAKEQATKESIKKSLAIAKESYTLYLQQQRIEQTDAISQNPYFNKYDVASDSRNIIRELRGVVSEDIVDRGLRQSQKLLTREFESRWMSPQFAEQSGMNQLTVLELVRPAMNNMGKNYR